MPTGQQYSSVATQATLTGGISAANTTCTVNTISGFPAAPFTAVLDIGTATQEIVDVTNVSSLTLTITRGVDGSAAQAHSPGATVTHSAIARDLREARAHIDASSSNDSQGHVVHGLAIGSSVVGTTDTQTLSNKTLTSPTINSPTISGMSVSNPTITGTVAGGATYSSPSLSGTVGGSATYTTPTLQNPTVTNSSTTTTPLTVNGLTSTTADLVNVEVNGTSVLEVKADGALVVENNGTTNVGLTVTTPSGSTASVAKVGKSPSTYVEVDTNGQVLLTPGPLSVGGITGAVNTSRYVGSTTGGPPTSGTFNTGDWIVDNKWGVNWICTAGGSPGTWTTSGQVLIGSSNPSTGSNISFSSIPQYFTHLKIVGSANANNATTTQDLNLQFNGDTNVNSYSQFGGFVSNNSPNGSGFSGTNLSQAKCGIIWGNANPEHGTFEITIPSYSSTAIWKNFQYLSAITQFNVTTAYNVVYGGGQWHNGTNATQPITSIVLFPGAGSGFVAGSNAQLYALP